MVGKTLTDLATGNLTPAARTAVWRVLMSVTLVSFISYANGWVPRFGGFALAADVVSLQNRLTSVEKSVVCNAISNEIARLRGEKRTAETQMFEAQQMQNIALIQHLTATISSINSDIDDQVQKRSTNQCN